MIDFVMIIIDYRYGFINCDCDWQCVLVCVCSDGKDSLPTASTCGSVLVLPNYSRSVVTQHVLAVLRVSVLQPLSQAHWVSFWIFGQIPNIFQNNCPKSNCCH